MLMKIEGAVVFITGANRGLGLQLAKEALARGAKKVSAAARDPSKIGLAGVVPVKLDVTNAADVAAVAEQCADVTLLIDNAGIVGVGDITMAGSAALLREQLETNPFGILGMGEVFAGILGSNGGGAMLNILSILSWVIPGSSLAMAFRRLPHGPSQTVSVMNFVLKARRSSPFNEMLITDSCSNHNSVKALKAVAAIKPTRCGAVPPGIYTR
jgi:NAD(P)-dependent dehydrogenase (short-subunit alcohol dehydrogenase family)